MAKSLDVYRTSFDSGPAGLAQDEEVFPYAININDGPHPEPRASARESKDAPCLDHAVRRKLRRAFFLEGLHALRQLGAVEAEEFHGERGVEAGAGAAQPVVEGVFGPADGALGALGE